jgi:hypothetical protein
MRRAELSPARSRARLATALVAVAFVVACGSGEDIEVITEMPMPNRDSAAAEEPAPAAAGEEAPVETGSSRTEIVRNEFTANARDPFTPPPPQQLAAGGAELVDEIECDIAAEPLGMTEVNNLRLIGLVTGTAVPRAMFSNTDAQGRAIIVAEGAKVGPRCSSFISDIRDNQIVVTQRTADADSRTETVIQLTTARVAAEVTTNP